jgi:hypothetical protein
VAQQHNRWHTRAATLHRRHQQTRQQGGTTKRGQQGGTTKRIPELQTTTKKETCGWLEKTLRVSQRQQETGEGKPTVAVADLNTKENLSKRGRTT